MSESKIDFNINHIVEVKLTDTGRAELKRQDEALRKEFPKLSEFQPRKEDDDGWSVWQMHELMERLGFMCRMGSDLPFEVDIKIIPQAQYTDEEQDNIDIINNMCRFEMANLSRNAPIGHPYFDTSLPYNEVFVKRFAQLGGWSPKNIGW